MGNMSASILRNLVASVFGVNAKKVHLSGEISPEESFISYTGHSWAHGWNVYKVWGFDPHTGFVQLNVPSYFSDNGTSIGDDPMTIAEMAKNNEFIFFIVNHDHEDQNYQGDNSWTLYKAPDFREYWKKIEEEDIARWEQWLAV